jgi:Leucine carboxyl methyltransferase
MDDRQPSQTALAAAAARAAHPVVDQEPLIFRDPVAADLIGEPGAEMVGYHRRSGDHIVLAGTRAQVTVRSHYTGRRLAELADRGLDQYVILGAGLDSFAYRSPLAGRLRVFEVDHPACTSPWRPSPPPWPRSAAWPPAPSWSWSTRCRPSCATRPARTMPGSRCRSPPSGASPG